MRILLVDDMPEILEIFYESLKRPDVEIDRAENCREALDLLAKNSYDWVTLDLRLPDGNGIDILKEIRDKYADTRVVVISTDADSPILREKLLSLGVDAMFPKPFPMQELVDCIYGS